MENIKLNEEYGTWVHQQLIMKVKEYCNCEKDRTKIMIVMNWCNYYVTALKYIRVTFIQWTRLLLLLVLNKIDFPPRMKFEMM